jgi:uncharacterized membrane protein
MKMERKRKSAPVFIALISLFLIFAGYKIASSHYESVTISNYESELNDQTFAKVVRLDSEKPSPDDSSVNIVLFTASITSGSDQGKETEATQYVYKNNETMPQEVKVGDSVILGKLSNGGKTAWAFENYDSINQIIILSAVFIVLILLFGGKKGINTILSLTLTGLALFFWFIPSILAGFNIYASTILVCAFIVGISFTLTGGINQKSLAAAIGCTGGVIFSGCIYLFMEKVMKLTGYYNTQTSQLDQIFAQHPLNLKAIVFAMVTIGALGATMDVAMSIASSLEEIRNSKREISAYSMIQSGLSIGKDIMGTMTNTLILAYIGSSLIMVIVYAAAHYPLLQLLNKEEIIIEILESLVGSLGMLFTIPFTTVVSALLFARSLSQSSSHLPNSSENRASKHPVKTVSK